MRSYDLRHVVTFEDTNVAGNVYFARYVGWQGRCRETFLLERAPEVLAAARDGLALVTLRCSCEYVAELELGDEVEVRMSLRRLARTTVDLEFEYVRVSGEHPALVARGSQSVAFMHRSASGLTPAPLPDALRAALADYAPAEEARDGRLVAIEVKASVSPPAEATRNLAWLRDKLGERFIRGIVLHMGEHALPHGDRITAVPLSALWGHAAL